MVAYENKPAVSILTLQCEDRYLRYPDWTLGWLYLCIPYVHGLEVVDVNLPGNHYFAESQGAGVDVEGVQQL